MSHPHQSMLDEFEFAIKHFVPTIAEELQSEAKTLLDELQKNESLDDKAIQKVFYEIGVKEYPHRRAYNELTQSSAKAKMQSMVIEHVDETVRSVIKPHLDSGVSLEELVSSKLFTEELDAKQRYQVEDGILVAKDKLVEVLKKEAGSDAQAYKALVEKWQKAATQIDEAIGELEKLAQGGDESQQSEIKGKVARFREGFLVTEQDPELEEIKKEIEYWTNTFAEEE
jgi:hypothetical protein